MLPHNDNNNHAQDRPHQRHRGLKQAKTEEDDGGDYDFDDAQFDDDADAAISLFEDDYGFRDDDDYSNGGADDDDDATTNNNNNNGGGGGGGGGGKNKNKDKNSGGGNENDGAPGVGVVKEDDDGGGGDYDFDDAQFDDDADADISTGDYYYMVGGNDDKTDDTTTTSVKDEAGDEEDYVYESSNLGTAPSELGLSPPSPAAVTTTPPPTTNLQPTEGVLTPESPVDDNPPSPKPTPNPTPKTSAPSTTFQPSATFKPSSTFPPSAIFPPSAGGTMTATIGMDEDGLASAPTNSLVIELFLVVPRGVETMNEFDTKLVNTVYEVLFEKLPSEQLPTKKEDDEEIVLTRKFRRLKERSTKNNRNYPSPRGSSNINTDSTRTRTVQNNNSNSNRNSNSNIKTINHHYHHRALQNDDADTNDDNDDDDDYDYAPVDLGADFCSSDSAVFVNGFDAPNPCADGLDYLECAFDDGDGLLVACCAPGVTMGSLTDDSPFTCIRGDVDAELSELSEVLTDVIADDVVLDELNTVLGDIMLGDFNQADFDAALEALMLGNFNEDDLNDALGDLMLGDFNEDDLNDIMEGLFDLEDIADGNDYYYDGLTDRLADGVVLDDLDAVLDDLDEVLVGMLGEDKFDAVLDDLDDALAGMFMAGDFNVDDLNDALGGILGDFNEDDLNDALGGILGDLNNLLNDVDDAPIGWYSSGDSFRAYDVEEVNIESTTNVINCADYDPTMLSSKMMEKKVIEIFPVGSVCIESIITFDSISNMYSGTDLEKLRTDVATTIATDVFQEKLVSNGIDVVGVYYPNGPKIAITADGPPELVVPVVSTQNSTTGEAIISSTSAPTFLTPVVAPTLAPGEYIDPCSKLGGDCDGCVTQDGCLWCVAESFCFNSNPPKPDGSKRERRLQQSCGGTITGSKKVCKLTTLPPTKKPTPSPTTRYPTISPATTIPPVPEQDDAHGDGDSHDHAVDDPPLEVQATEQQDEDGAYSLPSSLMNTIVLGICTSSMILLLSFYQN